MDFFFTLEQARIWLLDSDQRVECVGCKQVAQAFDFELACLNYPHMRPLKWPRDILPIEDAIAWCHSDARIEYGNVRAACQAYADAIDVCKSLIQRDARP